MHIKVIIQTSFSLSLYIVRAQGPIVETDWSIMHTQKSKYLKMCSMFKKKDQVFTDNMRFTLRNATHVCLLLTTPAS